MSVFDSYWDRAVENQKLFDDGFARSVSGLRREIAAIQDLARDVAHELTRTGVKPNATVCDLGFRLATRRGRSRSIYIEPSGVPQRAWLVQMRAGPYLRLAVDGSIWEQRQVRCPIEQGVTYSFLCPGMESIIVRNTFGLAVPERMDFSSAVTSASVADYSGTSRRGGRLKLRFMGDARPDAWGCGHQHPIQNSSQHVHCAPAPNAEWQFNDEDEFRWGDRGLVEVGTSKSTEQIEPHSVTGALRSLLSGRS
ncbi:hypothetical protein GIY30_02330 [Gordonia sp. HNM0687]|uniref:Uncharacterized protein n=1 Tax=Gordonia mangrovi TaxID=2665643 RepID=A0A6L7GNT8_9ACTN|nr:hypothetical protein [Gordonia mangrovi]MXP20208.1 hypothetical protein [Gordonia mangrovi]UVF79184.1 hypothetical protein NWF22_04905 [Gordonia mangrovi]